MEDKTDKPEDISALTGLSSLRYLTDLTHKAQGDPLVVGVVHLVITVPLPGTVALECWWDVESGIHPAVGL